MARHKTNNRKRKLAFKIKNAKQILHFFASKKTKIETPGSENNPTGMVVAANI